MDEARFLDLLEGVCRRPAMFTGAHTVDSVAVLLTGYVLGVAHGDPASPGIAGYLRWVEARYDVFYPAWSWTRILLHHHGDDRTVLDVLPSLFRAFLAEREAYGVQGIEARHRDHFGGRTRAPERTHTTDPG
ncbi:hypothetical protein ACWD6K_20085 [Streptomyces sp. NPDC002431]